MQCGGQRFESARVHQSYRNDEEAPVLCLPADWLGPLLYCNKSMEFAEIIQKAKEIQKAYRRHNRRRGHKKCSVNEYAQGFAADVGDLTKLIMARNNLRGGKDIEKKLAHELSDCLWSIIIIAQECHIDLEKEFVAVLNDIKRKFE